MSRDKQPDTTVRIVSDEERALLDFVTMELLDGRDMLIEVETPLFEDRLIDSMNILKLIGYIENKLGRRLDEKDIVMPNFRTVRTMVEAFFCE
jgi:acyl carrier protein